jgi:hypothetical protein
MRTSNYNHFINPSINSQDLFGFASAVEKVEFTFVVKGFIFLPQRDSKDITKAHKGFLQRTGMQ